MKLYLTVVILFVLPCCAWSQTLTIPATGHILILHPKVGSSIDRATRDHYHFFGSTLNFRKAVIYQSQDSIFHALITMGAENSPPRDTLVTYSYMVLGLMAEKVEYFDSLAAGTYRPGHHVPTLYFVGGGVVVPPVALPARTTAGGVSEPGNVPTVAPKKPGSLPLAPSIGYDYPRYFPSLNFALGINTYSPDFSDLAGAFGKTPSFGISPMLTAMIGVSIAEAFALQTEGHVSVGGDNAVLATISGVFYLPIRSGSIFSPFVGAGVSFCSLSFEQSRIIVRGGVFV